MTEHRNISVQLEVIVNSKNKKYNIVNNTGWDAKKANTLASLRLAAICLIVFAAFLQFDKLTNIRDKIITRSQQSYTSMAIAHY